MEGLTNDLSPTMVLSGTRNEEKGIYFFGICLSMGQKTFVDVCFNDLTDNQGVASKIQGMEDYTFKIDETFLYKKYCLRDAIKRLKDLRLVSNVTGIDSTVVHIFSHIRRGYVNGKEALLFNLFQCIPHRLQGY